MLLNLICASLVGLTVSLPIDAEVHSDQSLALRDPGNVATLAPRYMQSVTYTTSSYYQANSDTGTNAGPLDPNDVTFYMQGDGNFVAYAGQPVTANAVWATNTAGNSICAQDRTQCYVAFLSNGNLVVSIAGNIAWQTGTAGKGYSVTFNGAQPYVQIRNSNSQVIWSSPTPPPNPPSGPCQRDADASTPSCP